MAVANAWPALHCPPRPYFSCSSSSSPKNHFIFARQYPILIFPHSNNSCISSYRKFSKFSFSGSKDGLSSTSPIGNRSCSSSSDHTAISDLPGWDWTQWTRHFTEMEQAESYASILKFELEDAVENEDFQEAAKLKKAIAEATSKDTITEIMSGLKDAIAEERYHDASRLCQSTGSGLVGWWVGYSKGSDNPFGRLIRISPAMGRFIARSYTPRQLINASPGTPLFEFYVIKKANSSYNMQAVFLKRTKSIKPNPFSLNSKPVGSSTADIEDVSVIDAKVNDNEIEKRNGKGMDSEEAAEEGVKSVINFLKDRIPDLKLKVIKLNVTEESDSARQAIEEVSENSSDENNGNISSEFSEEEVAESLETSNLDDNNHIQIPEGGESTTSEDDQSPEIKLFVGGIFHDKEDNPAKDEFIRVPAEIKDLERDSFVFHIPRTYQDLDGVENSQSAVSVATIAAQSVSELMPPDVAKAFLFSDKVSPKISKKVREILKLGIGQAQNWNRLSEYTSFTRVTTSGSNLDPFDGLYVGAFGPYGTEIVHIKRKYGNWNSHDEEKSSDIEFFEYVEAITLTGDLNVRAGEVIFRCRIGKGIRSTNKGMYPVELGVAASYKGQGRIAEPGFKNPKWVEGELLQLNGKGFGPHIKGADLGFMYTDLEQSFLLLFSRLKLPD
ncbi:unnamed protein product [Cuscuta epithymum]|uniref:Protein EXECUTER 2, chloroplastic n=1 Tax=Cuscuta epithymum TaxID=186058 RepID=A0AAV0EFS7_9ASTE|nr:unnamed protein product [Cuscuta epithymum]